MVNKAIIHGRLVADPETRTTSSGTSVCNFRVAWSRKYKEQEAKLFLPCTAWGNTAEIVQNLFSKGKEIVLEGELRTNAWQDQNGNSRSNTELSVDRVHFVGPKESAPEGSPEPPPLEPMTGEGDEDLPF